VARPAASPDPAPGKEGRIRERAGQALTVLACTGRFGPTVLPVNYDLHEGTIVFRTGMDSAMVGDLRTGIADAEYNVAFEIDQIQPATQEGWSVLVQGAAHFVDSEDELAPIAQMGVQAWPGGPKEQFIRVIPRHVTGRRIRRVPSRPEE
jgi:hypothetical protein